MMRVLLAEGIAGTEEEFAIMMTSKARIGMNNTNLLTHQELMILITIQL